MRQYHYAMGDEHFGPFTIEELKTKGISRNTLTWYEGLESWTEAASIEELRTIFNSTPPPLKPKPSAQPVKAYRPRKSRKLLGLAAVSIVVLIVVLGSRARSTNSSSDPDENTEYRNDELAGGEYQPTYGSTAREQVRREPTEQELRADLYQKEILTPKSYLSLTYNHRYRFFVAKDEISGTIYNSASMATFKDVVITVIYSSATDTEIGRENFIVYKFIYPNSSETFTIRTESPNGTRKISVEIKEASPAV